MSFKKVSVYFIIAIAFLIQACSIKNEIPPETTEYFAFKTTLHNSFTPTSLNNGIKKAERDYLNEVVPIAFFVSKDGKYASWWRCTEKPCKYDTKISLMKSKKECESYTFGQECYLHYVGSQKINKKVPYKNEITYKIVLAKDTKAFHPHESKGVILYFPGFSGWKPGKPNRIPKLNTSGIPSILNKLNSLGWHIDRINIDHFERFIYFSDNNIIHRFVCGIVEQYREKGFNKVYLYGHSRGGSEILRATQKKMEIDGIVLTEPDFYGGRLNRNGTSSKDNNKRYEKIGELLNQSKAQKIIFAIFKESFWYRDEVGKDFTRFINGKDAWILNGPDGYAGHAAGWTMRFANEYTNCFDSFLSSEDYAAFICKPKPVDNTKMENWATRDHLLEAGLRPVGKTELQLLLKDKTVYDFDLMKNTICQDGTGTIFKDTYRLDASSNTLKEPFYNIASIKYTNDGYCKYDKSGSYKNKACNEVYIKDDFFFLVPKDNPEVFVEKLVPGFHLKKYENLYVSETDEDGQFFYYIPDLINDDPSVASKLCDEFEICQ